MTAIGKVEKEENEYIIVNDDTFQVLAINKKQFVECTTKAKKFTDKEEADTVCSVLNECFPGNFSVCILY